MPQATMTYVLSHIMQNIPPEILELAFKPRKYNSSIEQRIIATIINGPILLDTNLVGGKRRDIIMQGNWRLGLPFSENFNVQGTGPEGAMYLIPPDAREDRNIASVIGVTPFFGSNTAGSGVSFNGNGQFGNNALGMASQMLNSRTFAQTPKPPQVTLEGTNMIRFWPDLVTDGVAVSVMLEYDAEFLNMNQSAIFAMCNLCLCAVQRYISTNLRVSIDETEVVAGMEIGVIKEIVVDYKDKAADYQALLMKLKGAMTFDSKSLSRMIFHAL